MRAQEAVILAQNVTGAFTGAYCPTPDYRTFTAVASVEIEGGRYAILSAGTLATPLVQLLGPDGTSWVNIAIPVVAGPYATVDLPPGQVRCSLAAGATGAYLSLARIPVSE
jgi:hypothetical protein